MHSCITGKSQATIHINTKKKRGLEKKECSRIMMDIQGINIVKRGEESKRWCRLEKTKYASNDTEVLKNRLLVTDEELRCVLGVGRKTAKAIAQEADAVVRVNGRKLNSMEKIRQYIDTVAGK